ncbi:MAG: DUF3015 family protein [Deferrisomatales bacterium]
MRSSRDDVALGVGLRIADTVDVALFHEGLSGWRQSSLPPVPKEEVMKTSGLRVLTVGLVLFGAAAVASAANTDRFGMGGCGLGSLLFGDDPGKVSQIVAATTNGTSGNQTFGITSGTSNCDPRSGPAGAKLYIETNREALAKDAARGSGETVAALSALAGCRDAGSTGGALQRKFGAIFPNAGVSDEHVSSTVLQILGADAALSCAKLL